MDSAFYTIQEVSKLLKVSVSTIRRTVRAGHLTVSRIGPQIRISERALDAYVNGVKKANGHSHPSIHEPEGPYLQGQLPHLDENARTPPPRRLEGVTANGIGWAVVNADVVRGLREVESESISCAVTSPPYYWQRDYEVDGQLGHEASIAGYVEALATAFRELQRTLRPDGTFFLNLGDTYYSAKGKPHGRDDKHNGRQMMRRHLRAVDGPGLGLPRKSLIGIPWRVALRLQDDGWTLRSSIVWQRPASMPEPTAHDRPWRSFEHIFLFSKGPRYWFDRKGLRGEEDIWSIVARPDNPGTHFAPYPRELVERCLACGCRPGGAVLDPFVGSGTTMTAALARGSPAVGIELKREYADYTAARIAKEFGITPR